MKSSNHCSGRVPVDVIVAVLGCDIALNGSA